MDPFKPYTSAKPAWHALSGEDAQAVALKALSFIAADEELLLRFVALSGCVPDDLRHRIADAAFLGGVIDCLLADEPTLLAFAEATGLPPEAPLAARAKLP